MPRVFLQFAFALCLALVSLSLAQRTTSKPAPAASTAYAPSTSCATCHGEIARTYAQTGMGRSFYRPSAANTPTGAAFYHKPSDSYFATVERGGRFYQRRQQFDTAGREVNIMEKQIDFVLGSGNHARAYLHRTARNTLIELPLGWYSEKGGYWAMNPGYDRPDHEGFRRKVNYDCMYCHNGYPRIPAGHDRPFAESVYLAPLPEGIDCQRCHGPGARHVQLAQTAGSPPAAIRAAIVNPARLAPERREEVCIQCHLESTSFPLPNSLPRYEKGPFAFRPGRPLSDYWLFFDHAPNTGRDEKFELVNAVYRMRRSQCFLKSNGALGCTSCHNPHDVPRGAEATQRYDAACRQCHAAPFDRAVSSGKHTAASDCASCHMPKRRSEDVVHAVVTDHLIQRRKPAGGLLAELPERHEAGPNAYRGEVAPYYPPHMPSGSPESLYLALAQVIDKSDLKGGIPKLAAAIERTPAARSEFLLGLAQAWQESNEPAKALPLYREASRRDPASWFARLKLGAALRSAGQTSEAIRVLNQAAVSAPTQATIWHELGLAYRAHGNTPAALSALKKATTLDPDLPEPFNNLGIVQLASGDTPHAQASFREAIRIHPAYADAHNNLGNLLSVSGDFAGARQHFETSLSLDPAQARTHYNYAMTLGRARQFGESQRHLEAAIALDPEMADAHLVLAQILLAQDHPQAAIAHLQKATAAGDPTVRRAAEELLREVSR